VNVVEIPLKRKYLAQGSGKKQKGGHNQQGTKHANKREQPKGALEEARRITAANKRVMVLLPSMKRRFMTETEWRQMPH
jgi:hypothetical protein